MPEKPERRNFTTLEELTVSNIYHLEALTELLEEAGITTKNQVLKRIGKISRGNTAGSA